MLSAALTGIGNSVGNRLDLLEAYDPGTDAWTTKAPMPTGRDGLGVGAINGILYAVGGHSDGPVPSPAEGVFWTTLEAYHP